MATQSYVSNLSESVHSTDQEDRYAAADGEYPLKSLEEGCEGDKQVAQGRKVDHLFADVSCWCVPSCVSGPGDFCGRFGNWMLLNSDQFISSIVVAISLIPESISYALIAGLPPSAALQTCWISNVITALIGGRPGMITSASGLCALLLHRLVNTNTVENTGIMFVPYAVGFAGILQIVAAIFQLGRLVSNFPAPVVVGMVNAVAILALVLQCRYIKVFPLSEEEIENGWEIDGEDKAVELEVNVTILAYYGKGIEFIQPWLTLAIYGAEAAAAFLISMFLPRLTTFLPATLISVLVVIAVEFGLARQFGVETPLIGDYGGSQVAAPWETILSPNANFDLPALDTFENWKIILGYGGALFVTSFTETAISLNVVDRLDESRGPGAMVLAGQGVANIVSSLFGGMSATGVVTMSVLADRTFGTTCLSTFLTGVLLFVFVSLAHPVIDYIPLSAVSGISIAMVCSFIQWRSLIALFTICMRSSTRDKLPPYYNITRTDVLLMLVTTAAALAFDFAAMGLFCLAVIIVVYARARACCRKEEKDEGIVHEGESLQCDDSFPEMDQRDEESLSKEQDSCDIGSVVLDAAEEAIFSVKT